MKFYPKSNFDSKPKHRPLLWISGILKFKILTRYVHSRTQHRNDYCILEKIEFYCRSEKCMKFIKFVDMGEQLQEIFILNYLGTGDACLKHMYLKRLWYLSCKQ